MLLSNFELQLRLIWYHVADITWSSQFNNLLCTCTRIFFGKISIEVCSVLIHCTSYSRFTFTFDVIEVFKLHSILVIFLHGNTEMSLLALNAATNEKYQRRFQDCVLLRTVYFTMYDSEVYCNYVWKIAPLRARWDCLTKPSDISHLTKLGWTKLQVGYIFAK